MDQQEWKKVNNIVDTALELDGEERTTFIKEQCAGNKELRYKVTELLKSIEQSDTEDFLEATEAFPAYLAADLSDNDDQEHASSLVGETIDQYHIKKVIGHGGMGSVFLADRADDAYQGEVALKIMRQGMDTPSNIARFERERNILAKLDHPNIARLLDGGVTDAGLPYLVMEYVDGISLFEYCDKKNLPVEQRLDLFKEVCRAVRHAHQNAVIHRDLKPSNILITDDGNVKVLDFGIAKLVETKDSKTTQFQTRTGARMLTYGYAAPEQIEGQPVTTSTDAYSLGILLYELLCGVHPFDLEDKNLTNIEQLIREQTPYTLSRRFDNLPKDQQKRLARRRNTTVSSLLNTLKGDLEAIVMKALRKESESRYRSAGNMLEDLERREQNLPVIARKDTVRYKVGKFVRRHKNGIAVTVGVLLLIVGLTAFYTWQIAEERNKAQLEAEKANTVTAYMVDLFKASDPSYTKGDTITARQLLRTGEQTVQSLKKQPAVQSELLHVLGNIYGELSYNKKADSLISRALTITKKIQRTDRPKLASIYFDLAFNKLVRGKYNSSKNHLEQAINIQKDIFGQNSIQIGKSLSLLAQVQASKGQLDSASHFIQDAHSIFKSKNDTNSDAYFEMLDRQIDVLIERGNYKKAEKVSIKALKKSEQVFDSPHPKISNRISDAARVLERLEQFARAESLYLKKITMDKKLYGERHLNTVTAINNLAGLYYYSENLQQSDSLYKKAYRLMTDIYTKNHPSAVSILYNRANLKKDIGKYDEAEKMYKQILTADRKKFGKNHPHVASDLYALGVMYKEQNRYQIAEKYHQKSLKIRHEVNNPNHPSIAYTERSLAELMKKTRSFNKADSLYKKSLHTLLSVFGEKNNEVKSTAKMYSNFLKKQGRTPADSLIKLAKQ